MAAAAADLTFPDLGVYTRIMNDTSCICTALRQAALGATRVYDEALAPSGLKVTMFRLLRRIEAHPGASITVLAEAAGLDRSTLGRNLRVLHRDGLVRLGPGEDDRARSVALTEDGAARLAAAAPLWETAQARMRVALGPEAESLLATLRGVGRGAGGAGT